MLGYRVAWVLLTPGEYSQGKERLIARIFQQCRTLLKQAHSKRKSKACTVLQQFDLFARDLQRAVGHVCPWHRCTSGTQAPLRASNALICGLNRTLIRSPSYVLANVYDTRRHDRKYK